MSDRRGVSLARSWSSQLGLAYTYLFDRSRYGHDEHFALLDGVEGSFALSTTEVEPQNSLNWT